MLLGCSIPLLLLLPPLPFLFLPFKGTRIPLIAELGVGELAPPHPFPMRDKHVGMS